MWMLLLGVWLGGVIVLLAQAIDERAVDETLLQVPGDWLALALWPAMLVWVAFFENRRG